MLLYKYSSASVSYALAVKVHVCLHLALAHCRRHLCYLYTFAQFSYSLLVAQVNPISALFTAIVFSLSLSFPTPKFSDVVGCHSLFVFPVLAAVVWLPEKFLVKDCRQFEKEEERHARNPLFLALNTNDRASGVIMSFRARRLRNSLPYW